ncbi:MAG: hypothetical protein GTN70_09445, partial [Deltaproteobacteria bacterium]|nr:hypothetical protein [Deltaproteobacteria bacterium]
MNAIVQNGYGSPVVFELKEIERPVVRTVGIPHLLLNDRDPHGKAPDETGEDHDR